MNRVPARLKKILREGLLLLLAFVVIGMAINLYRTWDIRGEPAPRLQAKTLSGETFSLVAHEKPVLVYFWASWCPVCRFSETGVDAIARDYPVISVAMQSGGEAELRQYLQENGLGFAVIADEQGILSRQWSVRAVPSSFIIDESNRVRFAETGYTPSWGLRLRLWWAGL